jgi:hypothetical protein
MKLKSVMNGYLIKEEATPSFLPKDVSLLSTQEVPCQVSGTPGWDEENGSSSKEFKFSSREPLHSFCGYIFDLERQHGVHVSLSCDAGNNNVLLAVPHELLGGNHFYSFFREIDNIHYDVVESFKHG